MRLPYPASAKRGAASCGTLTDGRNRTVRIFLLRSLAFDTRRMREAAAAGFSTATDLADYLVRKGLPFRQAHEIVGRIVRHALDAGKGLEELALDDLRRFSALFEKDAFDAVSLEASLRARAVTGGTAPAAVREALVSARRLAAE